ncbi:MAG: alpha/beta fold hydrolase, partial [Caulobacterales bacterium]|nr:alpha/beta fold hydrolase [Caulobacterales bacterium]
MLSRILAALAALLALAVAALWWDHRDLAPATVEARYLTASDQFVEARGLRTRVRMDGPADAPPLILVHGFAHSLETWEGWSDALSGTFRVIRFDLPGHGLTGPDPDERYAVADHAAFIGAVMDALGLERAHVGGNSLGGLAAWRFALAQPERVDRLVLVDAGGFSINGVTEHPVTVPAPMEALLRAAPRGGVRIIAEAALADPAKATPEMVARMRDMMRRKGNGGAMVRGLELFTLPEPSADLARIGAPTLVLWGAQDGLIPLEHGRRMAELID